MLRKLVKLAIVLLIANAIYQSAPVFLHNYQFKDAVHETALFSKDRSDAEIVQRVMELAERNHIPLAADDVHVRREQLSTFIDVEYVEQIDWVPGYRRAWPFSFSVEGWSSKLDR
jgi:hypothetical protein